MVASYKEKEGFKTKREAKNFEREFLDMADASCDMGFSSLVQIYMKYYKLPSNPVRLCGSMGKKNSDTMQFWVMSVTSEEDKNP